jgi:hypothetical protein
VNTHPIRGAFAHKLPRAVAFSAWRVPQAEASPAIPLDIGQPDTLQDALNEALLGGGLLHKETLLIRRDDAASGAAMLYSYAIKRQSKATYVRGAAGPVRSQPLYLDLSFSLPVDAFVPVPPFDALRDGACGRDLSLVESR